MNQVEEVQETFSKLGVYVSAPTLLCFEEHINNSSRGVKNNITASGANDLCFQVLRTPELNQTSHESQLWLFFFFFLLLKPLMGHF